MTATQTKALALVNAVTSACPNHDYVVIVRPKEFPFSPNTYAASDPDRKRVADWLRHMADGIERGA